MEPGSLASARQAAPAAAKAASAEKNLLSMADDEHGRTRLWKACYDGHVDTVRLLLDRGAEVDRANQNGLTPLLTACFRGHVDVALLLLENGAEVDKAEEHGQTPLDLAAHQGHDAVHLVRLLLDARDRSQVA